MPDNDPLGGVRPPLRAVVRAAVPSAAELSPAAWTEVEAIIASALRARPPGVRRQVRLFLRVLEWYAVVRTGRRLSRADARAAHRLLAALERSHLLLLRRGVWGLRTLAFMGFYGRREERRRLGYRAAAGGWSERGGPQGPWPERGGAGGVEPTTLVRGGSADA